MRPSLPPGQQLAAPGKWPLVGERVPAAPAASCLEPWSVQIVGRVAHPRSWTVDELRGMCPVERVIDIHCVTRWSMPGTVWRGVPLTSLLALVEPTPDARFISFVAHSPRRHSTSLPLADACRLESLVAWEWQGAPIPVPHGGPLRMIVPNRYFYKSVKWLIEIELLAEDRLGYWEGAAGYHNGADPWLEQRFVAPDITRAEAARILTDRDLSSRTARGLDAYHRDLTGLRAVGAVLRDSDFSHGILAQADFTGANLSGSRFRRADLRGVKFLAADVEGVDFRGADLRGADFRDASLLGVAFCDGPETPAADAVGPALLDATTRFDASACEQLTPPQAAFVRAGIS